MKMTNIQQSIINYINKNFISGSVKTQLIGEDKVKVTDRTGENMTLTMNLYCDILDADTNTTYAISNLPHDLDKIGNQQPTEWLEVDRK